MSASAGPIAAELLIMKVFNARCKERPMLRGILVTSFGGISSRITIFYQSHRVLPFPLCAFLCAPEYEA